MIHFDRKSEFLIQKTNKAIQIPDKLRGHFTAAASFVVTICAGFEAGVPFFCLAILRYFVHRRHGLFCGEVFRIVCPLHGISSVPFSLVFCLKSRIPCLYEFFYRFDEKDRRANLRRCVWDPLLLSCCARRSFPSDFPKNRVVFCSNYLTFRGESDILKKVCCKKEGMPAIAGFVFFA